MGILDDAEVEVNDIPKDPFGFGNDYWPLQLIDVRPPKDKEGNPSKRDHLDISSTGKSYGGMFVFRCLDERYAYMGSTDPEQMSGQLSKYGQWTSVPPPKWAQEIVPFDKNSVDGKKLIFNWTQLCSALGFGVDEIGKLDIPHILGKTCLGKIRAKLDDETGFWEIRVGMLKVMPPEGSPEGIGEFTKGGTSNPAGNGTSAMSAMEKAFAEEKAAKAEMEDQ